MRVWASQLRHSGVPSHISEEPAGAPCPPRTRGGEPRVRDALRPSGLAWLRPPRDTAEGRFRLPRVPSFLRPHIPEGPTGWGRGKEAATSGIKS